MTLITDHIVILPILIPLTGGVLLLLLGRHTSLQARGALAIMSAALVSAVNLESELIRGSGLRRVCRTNDLIGGTEWPLDLQKRKVGILRPW